MEDVDDFENMIFPTMGTKHTGMKHHHWTFHPSLSAHTAKDRSFVSDYEKDEYIPFPCGLSDNGPIHPLAPDLDQCPLSKWIKPRKHNQGGYDAIFLQPDEEGSRTVFVECTTSSSHDAKLGHCWQFPEAAKKRAIFYATSRKLISNVTGATLHSN